MITQDKNYKEPTIEECLKRLETLFRYYQKDSEFNYQLTVGNSPFNILKKYIEAKKWQPIENYFKEPKKYDWVLVQFEDKEDCFRGVPYVAEYRTYPVGSKYKNGWYIHDMDINFVYWEGNWYYFNEVCKAVAFMPIEKCDL